MPAAAASDHENDMDRVLSPTQPDHDSIADASHFPCGSKHGADLDPSAGQVSELAEESVHPPPANHAAADFLAAADCATVPAPTFVSSAAPAATATVTAAATAADVAIFVGAPAASNRAEISTGFLTASAPAAVTLNSTTTTGLSCRRALGMEKASTSSNTASMLPPPRLSTCASTNIAAAITTIPAIVPASIEPTAAVRVSPAQCTDGTNKDAYQAEAARIDSTMGRMDHSLSSGAYLPPIPPSLVRPPPLMAARPRYAGGPVELVEESISVINKRTHRAHHPLTTDEGACIECTRFFGQVCELS